MPDDHATRGCHIAELTGAIAIILAFVFFFLSPALTALPLTVFLLICLVAPFVPWFGFYLPVICRAAKGEKGVALTFDDGPSPSTTRLLLDLLDRYRLPATFFVTGAKAVRHQELIDSILAHRHAIGNHSWSHDCFLMLRSITTIQEDIGKTQAILSNCGIKPSFFRPPVGITGPRLAKVLAREGLVVVNFSCRALDRGNKNIENLAGKILNRLRPGDIIMLHDLPLDDKIKEEQWLKELNKLFSVLAEKFDVKSLEQLVRHPAMELAAKGDQGSVTRLEKNGM